MILLMIKLLLECRIGQHLQVTLSLGSVDRLRIVLHLLRHHLGVHYHARTRLTGGHRRQTHLPAMRELVHCPPSATPDESSPNRLKQDL